MLTVYSADRRSGVLALAERFFRRIGGQCKKMTAQLLQDTYAIGCDYFLRCTNAVERVKP
jgi:hypothetical protein